MSGVTTATVLSSVAAASTIAGTGMSIIGAVQQSDAQRAAGETAYQNALLRNSAMEAEAKRLEGEARQREAIANNQQGVAQRQALEEKRRAGIAAGRATAVMAASGAGVDTNLVAGILGEGEQAFDTAIYEGDVKAQDSRYQAALNRHEAETRRWQGKTAVLQGGSTRDAMNVRAGNTLSMGITKGVIGLASMASKYGGGSTPGGDIDSEIADWSKYGQNTNFGSEFDL